MGNARIDVMRRGDKVLMVSTNFIAIQRRSGEVDLLPFGLDENSIFRLDHENILTIGYGDGIVECVNSDGIRCKTF